MQANGCGRQLSARVCCDHSTLPAFDQSSNMNIVASDLFVKCDHRSVAKAARKRAGSASTLGKRCEDFAIVVEMLGKSLWMTGGWCVYRDGEIW